MNIWHEAADLANAARQDIKRQGLEETPDQKSALAQVFATLSVGQELSRMIMDEGLTVRIEEPESTE